VEHSVEKESILVSVQTNSNPREQETPMKHAIKRRSVSGE